MTFMIASVVQHHVYTTCMLLFFGFFCLPLLWVLRLIPFIDDLITVDQCSQSLSPFPLLSLTPFTLSIFIPYAVSPHFSLISSFVLVDQLIAPLQFGPNFEPYVQTTYNCSSCIIVSNLIYLVFPLTCLTLYCTLKHSTLSMPLNLLVSHHYFRDQ